MKILMHWFDKAVDTVVTTQHAVSAVDMMVTRVCYLLKAVADTRRPPEKHCPTKSYNPSSTDLPTFNGQVKMKRLDKKSVGKINIC